MDSSQYGRIHLQYGYDTYGNMESRLTSLTAGGTIEALGPSGLYFDGRTYAGNQIADGGYGYDANGNMTLRPNPVGIGDSQYGFSPENRMMTVHGGGSGEILQEALYSGSDRWARVVASDDGGRALLTLRGASGLVESEYEVTLDSNGPRLKRHYAHAGGKLVASHEACPAPVLGLATSQSGPPKIMLTKSDRVVPTGDYTVLIESESGAQNAVYLPDTTPDTFIVWTTDVFDGHNRIRIKAESACGSTGYSNAVSYQYNAPGGGTPCIDGMTLVHSEFPIAIGGTGDTTLELEATASSCVAGATYNLYWQPEGGQPTLLLAGLSEPSAAFTKMPIGTGHGTYHFVEYDPVLKQEGDVGPLAVNDLQNTSGGGGEAIDPSAMATEYVHVDHLGSTRVVTDELGQACATYKYYPFGSEAEFESTTSLRMKFTGHERDQELNLDYMRARYYVPGPPRFNSPDPVLGDTWTPQTWSRYGYVANNPIGAIDPTGRYTCRDTTDCSSELEVAFEQARQLDLKSNVPELVRAAEAYGDPNVENGVTVGFDDLSGVPEGGTTVSSLGAQPDGSLFAKSEVTIDKSLTGTELRAVGAHEGSHVADAQSVVASIVKSGKDFTVGAPISQFTTEIRAWRVTDAVYRRANAPLTISCGSEACRLGADTRVRDLESTIERILKTNYKAHNNKKPLTSSNPGPNLIY